jgi:hypothetical protein
MSREELLALAERVDRLEGLSNETDVLVECALEGCRPNAAGTKVIYTDKGCEQTYWARDWTISKPQRDRTAAALRTLAEQAP